MVRVHFLQRREKLEKKSTGVEKSYCRTVVFECLRQC
jgi:hypothetical protein